MWGGEGEGEAHATHTVLEVDIKEMSLNQKVLLACSSYCFVVTCTVYSQAVMLAISPWPLLAHTKQEVLQVYAQSALCLNGINSVKRNSLTVSQRVFIGSTSSTKTITAVYIKRFTVCRLLAKIA